MGEERRKSRRYFWWKIWRIFSPSGRFLMGSSVCCTSMIQSGIKYIVTLLLLLLLLIAFIKRYSLLSSRLTALFSRVIPNEKTTLFVTRFEYQPEWCTTYSAIFVTWLMSLKTCCCLGERSVYTIQSCTNSLCHAGACVFSCNLTPALPAEWPGSFTC